jgi:hypothetical protein
MRLVLPLVLLLACAHSPPPPPGPRPLAGVSTTVHGPATLELRLLYAVQPDRSVHIVAELKGTGTGSVGPVEIAVKADKFLIDGDAGWRGEVAAGAEARPTVVLRPQGDGTGWVKVTSRIANGESSAFFPFLITPDEIRPCQAADEACKDVRDPDAKPPVLVRPEGP